MTESPKGLRLFCYIIPLLRSASCHLDHAKRPPCHLDHAPLLYGFLDFALRAPLEMTKRAQRLSLSSRPREARGEICSYYTESWLRPCEAAYSLSRRKRREAEYLYPFAEGSSNWMLPCPSRRTGQATRRAEKFYPNYMVFCNTCCQARY